MPLIDACIEAGASRNECIEALLPEELKKLEEWEQQNSRRTRGALRSGTFGARRTVEQPE